MIVFSILFIILCIAICFFLLIRSRDAFSRLLFLGLLSTFIICSIVLIAVFTGKGMYLDVALTLALLSFMDVQFYAVYLRRKGDL